MSLLGPMLASEGLQLRKARQQAAMHTLRQLALVGLVMTLVGVTAPSQAKAAAHCAVTMPNGLTPPSMDPNPQWYGNGKLWAVLNWPNGTVVFRSGGPGFVQHDGSLAMKFGWWRGVAGKLSISGKRLDAPAPPLRAWIPDGYGDSGFQAMYLIFPTPGCWEVRGKVGQATLTFVTRVVQLGVPARQDVE